MKEIKIYGIPAYELDNGKIIINPVYYNDYLSAIKNKKKKVKNETSFN